MLHLIRIDLHVYTYSSMKKSYYCSYIRLQLLNEPDLSQMQNQSHFHVEITIFRLVWLWVLPVTHSFFLVCILWLREEAPCWVSVEQSPFVLGLASENGELLLDECVQVTEGSKTRERHLFLFSDVIVFAKLK